MTKRVLITGAAGFIGSHFVEGILKTTDWEIVALDRLDETSALSRIGETDALKQHKDRFHFIWHDLRAPINSVVDSEIGDIDVVMHLAASTHVDRSITDPSMFVLDNVVGTCNILEFARKRNVQKEVLFYYQSTDEVFGAADQASLGFKEWDRFKASNPYSASKASGEELTYAFHNTYNLHTVVAHIMNCIGERQHHEKYLPLIIRKLLLGEMITIHADKSKTIPSSRSYVHARNVASAVLFALDKLPAGDKINIGGEREVDSLTLAKHVAAIVGKPLNYQLVNSVTNRPGHDMRYALDCSKLADLGFKYPKTFEESLEKTVLWYLKNRRWLGL